MNEIQQKLVDLAHKRYHGSYPDSCWEAFPLETAIAAMQASNEFDTEKYLVENPDIFGNGIDPVEHYMLAGASEGRVLQAGHAESSEKLDYLTNDKLNVALKQDYEARASQKSKSIPGMMAPQDRAIYFYYADKFSHADMIDAGCLVGCTTQNILDGATSGGKKLTARLKVFDQFIPDATTKSWLKRYCGEEAGNLDNFRPLFERNMSPCEERLEIHEGDFASSGYQQQKPISFLGLDLCKSVALTGAAIRKFYPKLMPGESVLVHQDYIHPWLPHIHITMELLADYFRPVLEGKAANCYVFQLVKPLPADKIDILLSGGGGNCWNMPSWYAYKERNLYLIDRAIEKLLYKDSIIQLSLAKAVYLSHLGLKNDAIEQCRKVKREFGNLGNTCGCEQAFLG